MHPHRLLVVLVGLLAVLVGCPNERNEGLILNVQTDFVPVVEFDRVQVQLDDAAPEDFTVSTGDNFGRPRFVNRFADVAPGRRTVVVALRQGANTRITRTVMINFSGSYLATVVLTRSCLDVVCARGETCAGGRCVPEACVTGREPSCPPGECTTDAMCTASATCVDVECIEGACFQRPNHARCAANQLCQPGVGCVARPEDPDAGRDAAQLVTLDASFDAPAATDAALDAALDARTSDAASRDGGQDAYAPPIDAALDAAGCGPGELRCLGVCTDVTSDLSNCGGCGAPCAPPRASPVCTSGRCEIDSCDLGFGNCDGDARNGCEADLNVPIGCGTTCATRVSCAPRANATTTCTRGACGFTCNAGFADCDGMAGTGCEADLNSPIGCGTTCGTRVSCAPRANATTTCTRGACGFACDSGFADCDGMAGNGCEVDLNSPIGCGTTCGTRVSCAPRANATTTCTRGACGFTCNAGFADCDGMAANGCESDLGSPLSCGATCATRVSCAPRANATVVCLRGACGFRCNTGFADCDGSPSNGCETDMNSPTSCGTSCGTLISCAARGNATSTCTGGMCGFTCNAGYGNCDGLAGNGCETNMSLPVSCGTSCATLVSCLPTYSCRRGVCGP